MKKTMIATLALGALTLAAGAAQAKPYPAGGVTAAEMAEVLKASGVGVTAEIGKDDGGDPMISASSAGINWRMFFYDCTAGRCKSIQFSAGFDLDKGMTYAKANEWNFSKRFARIALNKDMDPFVRYDIDAEKGFNSETADLALETWHVVLVGFGAFSEDAEK